MAKWGLKIFLRPACFAGDDPAGFCCFSRASGGENNPLRFRKLIGYKRDMAQNNQTKTHSDNDPAGPPAASPAKGTRRLTAAVLAGGLTVTLGMALWYATRSGNPPPAPAPPVAIAAAPAPLPPSGAPAAPDAPGWLTVHVSGAVAAPGLVAVAEGSRVADAIEAVGGMRPGAGFGSINLAAPVQDGMQLVVPWAGEEPTSAGGAGGAGVSGDGKVNINRAGVSDMTRLPGVGEVIATRIVDHRDANGPFRTVEDLLDVPGIGEGKLAAIRDYALVG